MSIYCAKYNDWALFIALFAKIRLRNEMDYNRKVDEKKVKKKKKKKKGKEKNG